MTLLLASVRSQAEACEAVTAGADVIDLKQPARGTLGALDPKRVRDIVVAIGGRRPTSATIGDIHLDSRAACEATRQVAAAGVDYVKVGLFPGTFTKIALGSLRAMHQLPAAVVVVMFADRQPDFSLLPRLADTGCAGVMLDTLQKGGGSLRQQLTDRRLGIFVEQAKKAGLMTGLAGSLRIDDIPPLMELAPDLLGFRGALCTSGRRTNALDALALERVRAQIPALPATSASRLRVRHGAPLVSGSIAP